VEQALAVNKWLSREYGSLLEQVRRLDEQPVASGRVPSPQRASSQAAALNDNHSTRESSGGA
jgi:hypothetical protein